MTADTKAQQLSRRWCSTRELSLLTGISEHTLKADRQHRKRKGERERFPSYTVGRRVLYNIAECEKLIAETRT
jgi:hypothetical protein